MQEVEVKARVSDFSKLENSLSKLGVTMSEPKEQKDIVYRPIGAGVADIYIYPNNEELARRAIPVLRIRETAGKVLLTLKKTIKNELDCIEHEVEVSDAKVLADIIHHAGFLEIIRIRKLRRKGIYKSEKGEYEICLDQVDELGDFVEVEKLTDGKDSELVQEELVTFLETLGILRENRVIFGYDTLLLKHRGEIPN